VSRVTSSLNLRIMPWKLGGESSKQHLRGLRHPDEYLIWNGSYNSLGNFDVECMTQARSSLPSPIPPSLLSTQRPSRSQRGNQYASANSNRNENESTNVNSNASQSTSVSATTNENQSINMSSNTSGSTSVSATGNNNESINVNSNATGSTSQSTSIIPNTIHTVPPSSLVQFQMLRLGAKAQTHSWIMIPFLQAIFENDTLHEHHPIRYVISKFYPTTNTWAEDILHYRERFKNLPRRIYDRLRQRFAEMYIPAFTQETLLFIFNNNRYSRTHIECTEGQQFSDITGQQTPLHNLPYQNDINKMKEISQRLLDAIMNLKIKYSRYEQERGIVGITAEQLVEIYPYGLQPPYIE